MHRARINKVIYTRSPDLEGLEAGAFEGFQGSRVYYARREFIFGFGEGSGTRTFNYRGQRTKVAANDLVVLQAGEPYSVSVSKPMDIKWVHIDVALFRKVGNVEEGRLSRPPYFLELTPNDPQLLKAVQRLHKAIVETAPHSERQKLLQDVVQRSLAKHIGQKPSARRGTRKVQMLKAKEYMQDSLSRSVPLKELADMTDMSVFQFVRAFAKEIGLTPHALLIHMRVQKARELLRRGHSATAASEEAGFADPSHLVRHFKRVFKVTPGAYASSASDPSNVRPRRPS